MQQRFLTPQKTLDFHKELEKKKPKLGEQYIVTEKKDGWWVAIQWDAKLQQFRAPHSSAMKLIPSMEFVEEEWYIPGLTKATLRQFFEENFFLIVEADIQDEPDFHKKNGKFNKSVGDYLCKDVHFFAHDIVFPNKLHRQAEFRQELLKILVENFPFPRISTLPILEITGDPERWQYWAEQIWAEGGEGIVVKNTSSPYEPGKRNSNLMRIKKQCSADLICLDFFSSRGEKGNIAWNLLLRNKNGVEVSVRVPKDIDIAEFHQNSPVGKVCMIHAMGKTPSGSYRQPRFIALRGDKAPWEID